MEETPKADIGRRFVLSTWEFLDAEELRDEGRESALWKEAWDEFQLGALLDALAVPEWEREGGWLSGGGDS